MAFGGYSSTFQGKFNFQGLFKTVLYIQVLFKPVQPFPYLLLKYTLWVLKKNRLSEAVLLCMHSLNFDTK